MGIKKATQPLTSPEDVIALLERWGFLPLFKNEIPGFSVEEHTPRELWFQDDADGPWEWKGPVIRKSGCAYGKFFRGKAVFISDRWYLDFANFRRDGYDFDARYDDGLAAYRDKTVYDILDERKSLLSKEWRNLWSFGEDGRKGFDTVVTRLQMQGYVVTSDFEYQRDRFGNPYGWGIARYETPEHFFGSPFRENVYERSPEESRERILKHLSDLFPLVGEKKIIKFAGL